jgi:hypothetical protein
MILTFFTFLFGVANTVLSSNTTAFMRDLISDLHNEVWKDDQEYFPDVIYPPIKWSQQSGIYPSYVHLNFHGNRIAQAGRNAYKFPDSNGFVSTYIQIY